MVVLLQRNGKLMLNVFEVEEQREDEVELEMIIRVPKKSLRENFFYGLTKFCFILKDGEDEKEEYVGKRCHALKRVAGNK